MSDVDVLELRVLMTRAASHLSQPRSARDAGTIAADLEQLRGAIEAVLPHLRSA